MLYIRIDDLHSETFFEDDFSQINALNASYHDNVTANITPGNVRITGPAGPAAKLMESLEKSVNGVNRAAGAPAANAAVTANAAVAPGTPVVAAQPAVNPLSGAVNPAPTTPQAAATGVAPITAFGGGSANNLVMETLTKATLAKQAVAETKVKATEDAAEIEKKKKTTEQEQNKEKLKQETADEEVKAKDEVKKVEAVTKKKTEEAALVTEEKVKKAEVVKKKADDMKSENDKA